MTYLGFISNSAMLKILNDIRLKQAFETNPLTGLPGNTLILESINNALSDTSSYSYLIYFDFDNFKPFNDKFGFRIGDRAIQSFANILRKYKQNGNVFIGHIGGDDFFMMIKTPESTPIDVINTFENISKDFIDIIDHFYTAEERSQKYYISVDRNGNKANFPLLMVSAAILEIPDIEINISEMELSRIIAELKKVAKNSLKNM